MIFGNLCLGLLIFVPSIGGEMVPLRFGGAGFDGMTFFP